MVLLIDEVDRVEVETEALLLEILSEYQVSIPELGTITATQIPLVFLTSNNTRELSEALKRRCLYLHVDYPDLDREKEIVLTKVPGVTDNLADQIARIVRSIRQLELKKAPSVSETIDWARTLVLLGIEYIDAQQAKETLHILLKYQTDITKAAKELSVDELIGRRVDVHARSARRLRAELRDAGLPVSLTENLDAMEAVQYIPIEDREAFKYALGATLVKNNSHWRAFETVFEVYFCLRGPQYKLVRATATPTRRDVARDAGAEEAGGSGGRRRQLDSLTPEEMAQLLMQALMNGDQAMMRALASQSVQRFAGMEPGRPVGGTYYLYRTLRNLDLDGMLEKLMDASREQVGGELTPLEERLERTSTTAASSSSRRRSRPRSAAGWSPTAAPRRWPRRCASRSRKTSSSCMPRATRWRR